MSSETSAVWADTPSLGDKTRSLTDGRESLDELLGTDRGIQVVIRYPMRTRHYFFLARPEQGGWTKQNVFLSIAYLYENIYTIEAGTSRVIPDQYPTMRNETYGAFRIYGHHLRELSLVSIHREDDVDDTGERLFSIVIESWST